MQLGYSIMVQLRRTAQMSIMFSSSKHHLDPNFVTQSVVVTHGDTMCISSLELFLYFGDLCSHPSIPYILYGKHERESGLHEVEQRGGV